MGHKIRHSVFVSESGRREFPARCGWHVDDIRVIVKLPDRAQLRTLSHMPEIADSNGAGTLDIYAPIAMAGHEQDQNELGLV